jgi:hypothetical protein
MTPAEEEIAMDAMDAMDARVRERARGALPRVH